MRDHKGASRESYQKILKRLGFTQRALSGGDLKVSTPIDGSLIARLVTHTPEQVDQTIREASRAFGEWRMTPAPRRGELVRLLGEELRRSKADLGALVSLESGKIRQEGLGEVQEMIDICDFAVGLSRQLYGLTIASERPGHVMRETWHPAGVCGVISAFNFPVAVWCWNTALALVCGDPVVWKPSKKTPLCALATHRMLERAMARFGACPGGLASVVIGGADVGDVLVSSDSVAIISATGSVPMGRAVAPKVAARLGRLILELGGNNAMVVTRSADLDMAVRAIVFSAVGTAGQRCTTLRRLIVHEEVHDVLIDRLRAVYGRLPIGDPLADGTLVGPLIDQAAFESMQAALVAAKTQGGSVSGGERVQHDLDEAYYVRPAIARQSQAVDATKRLNTSDGFIHPNVCRGRLLSWRATAFNSVRV